MVVVTEEDANTAALVQEQRKPFNYLLVIGGVLLVFSLLIIFTSKCIFKDPAAKYLTVLQSNLAVFDMTSDSLFLFSIYSNPELAFYFWSDISWLVITAILNVIAFFVLLRGEKQRSQGFAAFLGSHSLAFVLCVVCSPAKAGVLLLLESRLFVSNTQAFNADMSRELQVSLTKTKLLLILEDVVRYFLPSLPSPPHTLNAPFFPLLSPQVQATIVLVLQRQYLGGWTPMNTVKIATNLLALLFSICNSMRGIYEYNKEERLSRMSKDQPASMEMSAK